MSKVILTGFPEDTIVPEMPEEQVSDILISDG